MPCFSDALPGNTPGLSDEEHEREVERVGDADEVRGLVGAVGVDRPGHHQRLVRDHRDGVAAEPAQRGDHRTTEVGLHLEAGVRVEHDVDARLRMS